MRKHDEQLIDRSALILMSVFETERKSKVVTKHGEYYSRLSALGLIDKTCMLYASTYEGRVKATRHNLKQHKKTPILISTDGVAAYPTKSPFHPDCVWVFDQDYRMEKLTPTKTRLIYDQHKIFVDVDVSVQTLKKQRTRMYEMLYFYMKVSERQNT
ncbi:competence protein ComK [Planococcus salinus]|uniref:Competence protein n=1 Tax=Planococcus salinus TaxID=1848460 RepID=A0A3M8P8E6_9BACL|nr:competence protein ComK [Planococcus salinus]RNF39474.1 competence protein [Planococcus salinus]